MWRRLTPQEIERYDLVSLEIRQRARIVKVPRLFGGYDGLTSGRIIFLVEDNDHDGGRPLMAHELVHVEQFRRQGRLVFAALYFSDYFRGLARQRSHRKAYLDIRHERGARERTQEWVERRGSVRPRDSE
ncbi:MAG: DUF4157 domain-containing protein [Actinomycetia bacterium]|nr:DUF4157 domain-containing protein [Actinomycetes bacterium]MCP3909322.1 DUF4157 domain-containing protein [Actinomycetes bacterium]MCP4083447.1 DUF4157 domain-containing protein [Actinomycetes bacterium]